MATLSEIHALYSTVQQRLLSDPSLIIDSELRYMQFLQGVLLEIAEKLNEDFSVSARQLVPFWRNYPPEQRGRQPKGTAMPLLELGEKTIGAHLLTAIAQKLLSIRFPGVPTGGDVRFATEDAFIHLDMKLTGPNDNPDELVLPPNQVSGDGVRWHDNGIENSSWPVYYQLSSQRDRVNYHFQPKLPPFYVLNAKPLICLTYFLKAIYSVEEFGIQPLQYFELACVPNGLLMFEGYKYGNTPGLIIPGKDEKTKAESTMRIRIRLNPLVTIQPWRSSKVFKSQSIWTSEPRIKK